MSTKLQFKGFTEEMFNEAQSMANQREVKYFSVIEGSNPVRVEFTGFVGKKGSIAKFACSYVNAYLTKNPINGIKDASYKVDNYTKAAWTVTKVDASEVCDLFDEIAKAGFKMYKEMNPSK